MVRHRIRLHKVLNYLKEGNFSKLTYREYLAENDSTFCTSCELKVEETQFIQAYSEDEMKDIKESLFTQETYKVEINSPEKRFEVEC